MWARLRELTWDGEAFRAHQVTNGVLSQDLKKPSGIKAGAMEEGSQGD